jgi:hypothetical protein
MLAGKSSAKMGRSSKEKQPAGPSLQSGILLKWRTARLAGLFLPTPITAKRALPLLAKFVIRYPAFPQFAPCQKAVATAGE